MGFWSALKRQYTITQFTYLGGHPKINGRRQVVIERQDDDLILRKGFYENSQELTRIPIADIVNVSFQKSSQQSIGKAAGGALVGGLVAGPMGAIAGAAVRGGSKDTSIVVMTIKLGTATVDVLFDKTPTQDLNTGYSKLISLIQP